MPLTFTEPRAPQPSSALLGIEIGGTKLQIVSGDRSAKIVTRHRYKVDPSLGAEGIRRCLAEALAELVPLVRPAGVGVGFGGPVDWRTGIICRSHQIEGWSEFALGPWLQKLTGAPVWVDNDANVAALGEASQGAGVASNPVFYVTLGSGVGGGLVTDARIYHGAPPGEAEIGHVRLDRFGTIVEARCSGWAVDKRIRQLQAAGSGSVLCQLISATPGGEARHLGAALQANDAAAQGILAEVAEDLAFALSHVTHLFHPEIIVIGGGLSLVGEPLRGAVATNLPRFLMSVFNGGPRVTLAGLGEDSVPAGALELARLGLAINKEN